MSRAKEDHFRRIDVGVSCSAAGRADERRLALAALLVYMPAGCAFLAGIGRWNLDQHAAGLLQLVRQHGFELEPAHVLDRPVQPALLRHMRAGLCNGATRTCNPIPPRREQTGLPGCLDEARTLLDSSIIDSRAVMVFDGRWKMIHVIGFRPILFDLKADPKEFTDLGDDPTYAQTRDRLNGELLRWTERLRTRTTMTDVRVDQLTEIETNEGIWIGFWDEADVDRALKAPKGRS